MRGYIIWYADGNTSKWKGKWNNSKLQSIGYDDNLKKQIVKK